MMAQLIGSAEYRVEPLGLNHDRAAFSCGVSELDAYLQRQASQDLKRNLAAVFILTADGKGVAGFYRLSAHTIRAAELPLELAKKLPQFPLPVTLLGRMAIALSLQGQGWGEFLLLHALKRAMLGSRQVASWAVVVDAKAGARDFYLKHNFVPLVQQPDRLFLPMKTIERMFEL
jgi:predicted GNAT family N-acyltransferase